jgi:hypothetical protein
MNEDYRELDEQRKAAFEKWAHDFEPSKKETEAWADTERKRRAAWAHGPTENEIREWAQRTKWERAYRSAVNSNDIDDNMPRYRNWAREAMLASEGAMAWLLSSPAKFWESMVRAGYAWEHRWNSPAERSRRIPYPEDQ